MSRGTRMISLMLQYEESEDRESNEWNDKITMNALCEVNI